MRHLVGRLVIALIVSAAWVSALHAGVWISRYQGCAEEAFNAIQMGVSVSCDPDTLWSDAAHRLIGALFVWLVAAIVVGLLSARGKRVENVRLVTIGALLFVFAGFGVEIFFPSLLP